MIQWIKKSLIALFKCATLMIVFAVGVAYLQIKTPQIYNAYLRHQVGSRVFMILGTKPDAGGGTGFAIRAKSGKTVIISNAHVCEVKDQHGLVKLVDDKGETYVRKVLIESQWTDLCLIDSSNIKMDGMFLAEESAHVGQLVHVVGHPSLQPIAVQTGEVIGTEDVEIFDGMLGTKEGFNSVFRMPVVTEAQCSLTKQHQRLIPIIPAPKITIYLKVCYTVIDKALITSVHVQPGNSGSPVVNDIGDVVAVVFAKDEYNWGKFVSHKHLKAFLDTL